uniref:Uncharacterized protein n=1 Tax=Oryza brachyantha TaxID=4533 RepID=J3N8N0_ORYBR
FIICVNDVTAMVMLDYLCECLCFVLECQTCASMLMLCLSDSSVLMVYIHCLFFFLK